MRRAALTALLAFAAPLAAQPLSVQAYVDRTTMGDAETLQYTVDAQGPFASLGTVDPPPTRGLVPQQTTPTAEWASAPDGRRVLRLTWHYTALRPGEAEIGPTVLVLDGRRYTTDPIRIRVVPQAERSAPPTWMPSPRPAPHGSEAPADDLFLRPRPARTTAFVGEQVLLEHVIHYAEGVEPRNARMARAWGADGFWIEDLELPRTPEVRRVTVDGRPFDAVTLKRTALFPTRPGTLRIDPLAIHVDVARAVGRPGGLYHPFGARTRRETVVSDPVEVEVRPLPPGAPATFAGAVGRFTLDLETDREHAAVGETVELTVTLRGDGNLALLPPPVLALPEGLEALPPHETTHAARDGARLEGERRFTFAVIPHAPGHFELPALAWSYFDPEAATYRTLTTPPRRLIVAGGTSPEVAHAAADPTWRRVRPALPPVALTAAAFAAPLLVLLGALVRRRPRRSRPRSNPSAALAEARTVLRGSSDIPSPETRAASLETGVRRFLAARFGLPGHAVPAEIEIALRAAGVAQTTRTAVRDVLDRCAAARYAPGPPPELPDPDAVTALLRAADAEATPFSPPGP